MLREAEAERVRLEDEIARLRNQIVQDNRDLDELRMLNQQLRQGMLQYQQLVEKMTASVDGQSFGGGNGYGNGYANGTSYAATHSSYVAPPAPAPKPAPAPAPVAAPHKRSIEATIPPLKLNLGGDAAGGGSDRLATARDGATGLSVGSSLPADLDSLDAFTFRTDEGPVTVRARASGSGAYLKEMIQMQLYLSPRLSLTLKTVRAQRRRRRGEPTSDPTPDPPGPTSDPQPLQVRGEELRDDAIIGQWANGRVAAADFLGLSAAPRPLSDFSQSERLEGRLPPLQDVRVRMVKRGVPHGVAAIVRGVSDGTKVSDLKQAIVGAGASFFQGAPRDAAAVTLYFSPVFITPDVMLGRKGQSKLKPADSLALCQLTNNDILYAEWE